MDLRRPVALFGLIVSMLCLGLFATSTALATEPENSASAGTQSSPQTEPDGAGASAAALAPKNGCAEPLANAIQSYYDAVDDFAASFKQQTRSVTLGDMSLGSDAPHTGTVEFAKPGKMRWRYVTPSPSQVISDGEILWIYDETAREAQRLPVMDGYLTGAALEFLLGDGKILEEFTVEAASCEPDSEGTLELKLLPKQAASFESLGLRANRESGEILVTSLVGLFGDETTISFSDARINLHPDPATFAFEAPSGVAIIDLTSAP